MKCESCGKDVYNYWNNQTKTWETWNYIDDLHISCPICGGVTTLKKPLVDSFYNDGKIGNVLAWLFEHGVINFSLFLKRKEKCNHTIVDNAEAGIKSRCLLEKGHPTMNFFAESWKQQGLGEAEHNKHIYS